METRDSLPRVLLIMLPYWTPLIPPQGISHLKHFLQHHGLAVKTKDANTEDRFKELYDSYFALLRRQVPREKQGNFFNIGHDVLRNHMLAHIHFCDESAYIRLVKILIYNTFFTRFSDEQVKQLAEILHRFYTRLEAYMLDVLETERPGVLGISVPRDTLAPSLFAFRLTRRRYPRIRTVMGGSIFSDHLYIDSPNFEYFLARTPYIDNLIVGEGQHLFLALLQGRLPARQRVFTLQDLGGKTLDDTALNVPDMTDFNVSRDYPYLAAQASSSCPNQCSFCNVAAFFGKYREKDPRQTAAQMIRLYETYGTQLFFMNDALLNHVATGLAEALLQAGIAIYWDGYLRIDDTIDEETVRLWRRGGLYRVRIGVESGSQQVLDAMAKGITPAQTRKVLALLAAAGIKTTTYWVIGHPGETEGDFRQTLELVETLKNDTYEAECNPFIYGYSGQAKTGQWQERRTLLYPGWAKEMLILQSWRVRGEPSRPETFRRVCRFAERCRQLDLPNPYSLQDIFKADERWKKLHHNAVPNLVDFNDKNVYIDENKNPDKRFRMENTLQDESDFDF